MDSLYFLAVGHRSTLLLAICDPYLSSEWIIKICKECIKLGLKYVCSLLNIFFCLLCMMLCQKCLNHFTSCFCISFFIGQKQMWCKQQRGKNFLGKALPQIPLPTPKVLLIMLATNCQSIWDCAVSIHGRELGVSRGSCCEAEAAAALCAQLPN